MFCIINYFYRSRNHGFVEFFSDHMLLIQSLHLVSFEPLRKDSRKSSYSITKPIFEAADLNNLNSPSVGFVIKLNAQVYQIPRFKKIHSLTFVSKNNSYV